ncbi:Tm-1-like ATP-binding domain-containing protein [Mesorhizobium abyssinicae]|uniref:Tm-1-like ATP-binding domain-containing protein n=1 Tax=Mesorhizobium abyssinicae TaxID=1209958 RepID=A0ABU5ANA2_9HYPH|nr:Tm-1-like ATP-binding domain-containing protein [Mesorhizobium abyssinicae]MDX8538783.1 Tm-1-like ATP-binding domain-containing protein [Mesorhizobium abyssinicae]
MTTTTLQGEPTVEETRRILVIGTGDTKADELLFMRERIEAVGGVAVMMDVSVLGDPPYRPAYDRHAVARAADTTIEAIIASGDENSAMTLMALGASRLARALHDKSEIDGVIALGGSMGTDLALDVALALPLGVPKFVVSTIAYSHLLPPERIATDLMMILWAGGLYGLNSACKAVLSQACGAVVGAAQAVVKPDQAKPRIGMSSLGKSCLHYMVRLKPELEKRGYEVIVFHTTGMGGRALEAIAAQKGFVAVMDFSLQELANQLTGSVVNSGTDRLENAGRQGIPQIVAPGAIDMVDFPTWQTVPSRFIERPYHAHNRLLASVTSDASTRKEIARAIGEKLAAATGPTAFILPAGGIQQWDQEGEPLHEPEALSAFVEEMRASVPANAELHEIAGHINDAAFCAKALEIFDRWVAEGIVPPGRGHAA